MGTKTAPKSAQPAPKTQTRQAVTLEMVRAITPVLAKADRMVATYGLEPVDYAAIREGTEEHVVRICNGLTDNLNEKALAIFRRILGEDHPSTGAGYKGVASCLHDQGKAAQALPLYEKALEIRKRVLGEDHPDTAAG